MPGNLQAIATPLPPSEAQGSEVELITPNSENTSSSRNSWISSSLTSPHVVLLCHHLRGAFSDKVPEEEATGSTINRLKLSPVVYKDQLGRLLAQSRRTVLLCQAWLLKLQLMALVPILIKYALQWEIGILFFWLSNNSCPHKLLLPEPPSQAAELHPKSTFGQRLSALTRPHQVHRPTFFRRDSPEEFRGSHS